MVDASWMDLPTDLRRLVRCVVSRAVFDNSDLRLTSTRLLCDALAAWGSAPLFRRGEPEPAPFPDLPRGGWPAGRGAMHQLGITREELAAQWSIQKQEWHEEAALSDDLLMKFVPVELCLVIARIVVDGPDLVVKRLAAAITRMEALPIRPTKARPEGGVLSPGTVRDRRERFMRLLKILVGLHRDGYPSAYLDGWTRVPSRPPVSTEFVIVTDRTAPSRRLCRLVFASYRTDVLHRLGCHTVEQLPERIQSMSRAQLQNACAFRSLRMLATLVILLTTATRRHALLRIRRGDFLSSRVCWDGISRPAVGVRPAKRKGWDEVFIKPIPRPAGGIIEAWKLLVERLSGTTLGDDAPLFPATLTDPHREMDPQSMTTQFSGYVYPDPNRPGLSKRAAFPRHMGSIESLSRGRGPFSARQCTGYSPHALRHAADQLVEHGAPRYLADLGEYRIKGSVIVKAMCNHSMTDDPLLYKDFGNPQGLERLCCMGSEIAWAVLTTDAGSRMALDRDRIEASIRKRAALEAELESIRDRISAARIRVERITYADQASVTHSDWLRAHTLRSSIDLLWDERAEIQDALRAVENEIKDLQYDVSRRVAIPDEVADSEVVVDVAALQMTIDGTSILNGTRRRRRRRWLTPAEFAEVAGVSVSDLHQWVRDQRMSV